MRSGTSAANQDSAFASRTTRYHGFGFGAVSASNIFAATLSGEIPLETSFSGDTIIFAIIAKRPQYRRDYPCATRGSVAATSSKICVAEELRASFAITFPISRAFSR